MMCVFEKKLQKEMKASFLSLKELKRNMKKKKIH